MRCAEVWKRDRKPKTYHDTIQRFLGNSCSAQQEANNMGSAQQITRKIRAFLQWNMHREIFFSPAELNDIMTKRQTASLLHGPRSNESSRRQAR